MHLQTENRFTMQMALIMSLMDSTKTMSLGLGSGRLDLRSPLTMALYTRVNGSTEKEMVMEFRNGSMALDMRVSGVLVKLTDKESCTMLMATYTRVNGLMIRQMAEELTPMLMELNMLVAGKTINSMVTDWRPGQMVPSMRASTTKVRRMERED